MPWEKGLCVKLEDGRKEKVRKRPLLSNLKEIYQHFLTENPALKVGFSTFAMLRPKWCVPVVSSGTHNVFVCTYHENVKLMLSFIDGSLNYKEVLKACVCYFHQFFIFSSNDSPLKTMKNAFYFI